LEKGERKLSWVEEGGAKEKKAGVKGIEMVMKEKRGGADDEF